MDTVTPEARPADGAGTGRRSRADLAVYGALALVFVLVAVLAPDPGGRFGAWSLLPPAALFAFVLATRRVVEGFVWGSVLAVFLAHRGNLLAAFGDQLFTQLTTRDNLQLIVTLLSIGALVSVLDRSGLSRRFGTWASGLARSGRSASVVTLLASLVLSQDGYLSVSTSGAAMSGVNERLGRPRLFTAYLVRTGAVPGSAFNPLATGSVFVAGLLVVNGYVDADHQVSGYAGLIPYMFYPIAALLVGFLAASGVLPPLGGMRRAMRETPTGNAPEQEPTVIADGGRTPHLLNFFGLLAVLVGFTLALGSIQEALLVTLVVAAVALVVQRAFTPGSYLQAVVDGMKDMLELALIMTLAFVFVAALGETGFTGFIISGVSGNVPPQLLPGFIFVLFGITEFLVTLNWSLYLLALPVVIPLATGIGADEPLTIAALISAGLWGATACITSDIGLLTTFATKVEVFRHWVTNLPYQAIAWALAAVAFFVAGPVLT
ncbi:Na+/H+ antiporter NhaC family protein [Kineococcus sp. SYSU DK001]|uniref:Na+/H+ antiporter NhaC family protein n=1 Tax=Kineococcus sp. SYSU DK001 TaxID=3383122 RepID=UPI003D7CE575